MSLRDELSILGFMWHDKESIVVLHDHRPLDEDEYVRAPGWDGRNKDRDPIVLTDCEFDHELLDVEYCNGFGSPDCPRFIAYDRDCIYFPVQYDGATWVEEIQRSPLMYINGRHETPYPGG